MAGTRLAFALAGLGGFNAHGAGFLQAARDNEIEPDLVTATSGQIVVLAAYLKGAKDLKKGLIDKALEDNPFAQLYLGIGIDFFTNRFLPAQLYKPTRTAETIKELADSFNKSHIGVLFNAYNPTTGEGILFGNDAAREARAPRHRARRGPLATCTRTTSSFRSRSRSSSGGRHPQPATPL